MTYHNHTQEFAPCEEKRIGSVIGPQPPVNFLNYERDAQGCEAYIVEREFSEGDRIEELRRELAYCRTVM